MSFQASDVHQIHGNFSQPSYLSLFPSDQNVSAVYGRSHYTIVRFQPLHCQPELLVPNDSAELEVLLEVELDE
jgi:hypothetical protein